MMEHVSSPSGFAKPVPVVGQAPQLDLVSQETLCSAGAKIAFRDCQRMKDDAGSGIS